MRVFSNKFLSVLFFALWLFLNSYAEEPICHTIIAHRGASAFAPENTISSIAMALNSNADRIEIDVRLSKDNIPVLMHDRKLNRTTNGKGKIKDYSLEEIKELDAGSWFSRDYIGEKVPSLEEIINLVNGQKELLIEIKGGIRRYKGIDDIIVELIKNNEAESWCIIQSFDDRTLKNIRDKYPEIRIQKLFFVKPIFLPIVIDKGLSFYSNSKYEFAEALNPNFRLTGKSFVRRKQNNGFEVNIWGGKKQCSYKRFFNTDINGFITNFPFVFDD